MAKGKKQSGDSPGLKKGRAKLQEVQVKQVQVILQVKDLNHARSQEVLRFCMEKLSEGCSWRDLRKMLGLADTGVDRRWREIRSLLTDEILPATPEEALKANQQYGNYLMSRLEQYIEYIEDKLKEYKGKSLEGYYSKLHLEALKILSERYDQRTDKFLEVEKLRKDEKKNQGPTIIFQNNFHIPRPGDVIEEDPRLVSRAEKVLTQTLPDSKDGDEQPEHDNDRE